MKNWKMKIWNKTHWEKRAEIFKDEIRKSALFQTLELISYSIFILFFIPCFIILKKTFIQFSLMLFTKIFLSEPVSGEMFLIGFNQETLTGKADDVKTAYFETLMNEYFPKVGRKNWNRYSEFEIGWTNSSQTGFNGALFNLKSYYENSRSKKLKK